MTETSSSSFFNSSNQEKSSITTLPNVAHQLLIKLNSTNYLVWQTQLIPLLYSYDLANHIDGLTEPPPKIVNNHIHFRKFHSSNCIHPNSQIVFDQLAALKNPVGEDGLISVITNGLGLIYRPFIRSLEKNLLMLLLMSYMAYY